MRALRFDGQSVVFDRSAPEPVPGPGEAVVRPTLMGICSTDLEILRGTVPFVGTMGHEFVGVVERVHAAHTAPGAAIKHPLVGQRVVASINLACGTCDLCKRGLATHCRARSVLGVAGRDGCFADKVCLPIRNLHAVPGNVSDEQAVFAEPVAAALHARQMFKPEGRPYITVLGDGKLGLLCVQVMARLNASVRLIGKHAHKLDLCDRWGVKHRVLGDVGLRQDQDVVIDCTGSTSGLETALRMVRPRGKIILKSAISPVPLGPDAGGLGADHPAWRVPINLAPLVINEIELVGCRCGNIPDALAALGRGEVDVLPLITKRGKFADAPALLDAARSGQIKVLMAA